jgi:DNA-binding CsgD family transcriptional regulator
MVQNMNNRIAVYCGLALALFLSLVGLETIKSDEPFSIVEFSSDLFEMALLALAVVATSYFAQELRQMRSERNDLLSKLSAARADGEKWRSAARVHIDGLGSAIRLQFADWRLTAGEGDVAFLMLKGLSHKEIAEVRNSSAATVRQQAAAIYGKSGLSSRAELAAYFLEDLFSSDGDRGNGPVRKLTLVDSEN